MLDEEAATRHRREQLERCVHASRVHVVAVLVLERTPARARNEPAVRVAETDGSDAHAVRSQLRGSLLERASPMLSVREQDDAARTVRARVEDAKCHSQPA